MNLTLHLTEDCNMDCGYCPNRKSHQTMSEEVLLAACRLAFSVGNRAGLCFFGGEPLLQKQLIYEAIDYCGRLSRDTGKPFQCKMTTNGTLLDEAFLKRAVQAHMEIGLSYEGTCQDVARVYAGSLKGTERDVREKAKLLLRYLPDSYCLMTICPDAVLGYAEAVEFIDRLGFRKISAVIAYGPKVNWTEDKLEILEQQLVKLKEFYRRKIASGEKFFFGPFDGKIRECIHGLNPNRMCHLGKRQMPVDIDGKLYPCTQFIKDADYCLGDVFLGIDLQAQRKLAAESRTPDECRDCDLRNRCSNSCGCSNRLETGSEFHVSATQCSYERMLIRIADEIAEDLYADENLRDLFIRHCKA